VTFFTQATSEALGSVVYNGGLLNKIALDPETFPIASVAANAFQQAITTFPLMVLLSIVISHDPIRIVLTPIALLAFIGLVTGLALALSSAFVFFRDTVNIWAVAGFLLWMTSPVFYPAALVPARIQPWFAVNPVALSIAALREVTLGRGPIDVLLLVKFFVASLMILAFGHLIFISVRRKFMDLL
jgi:ABC-2 type transport system permease protein/lipopolysaccharide transport system permease protein